jgi:anti-anti-sigma factor
MSGVPLELEEVGQVTVVRITARRLLGQTQVDAISRSLLHLAGDPGRTHMLLDFGAVEALSSSVLAALLSLRGRLLAQHGRLAVCSLSPDVREVFALTGLEGPLNVYATEQEALLSFQAD